MHTSPLRCLLVVGLLACVHGGLRAQAEEAAPELTAFVRASTRLLEDWDALRARLAQQLAAVEKARLASATLEREQPRPSASARWATVWAAVEKTRASIHAQHEKAMPRWSRALRTLLERDAKQALSKRVRRRIAVQCLRVLVSRLRSDEPEAVRNQLANARSHSALATALAWLPDAAERRRFLARVADRLVATPGRSDLDDLCDVVRWDAFFLRELSVGKPQLDALSTDLILLFTERAADGIARSQSQSPLYRRGRFRDSGLRAALRDGGDQVRHFVWALRMFAKSRDLAATEALLALKERWDANTRKQALSKADLALNKTARALVEAILGERPAAEAAPRVPAPLPVAGYAERFRRALGGP